MGTNSTICLIADLRRMQRPGVFTNRCLPAWLCPDGRCYRVSVLRASECYGFGVMQKYLLQCNRRRFSSDLHHTFSERSITVYDCMMTILCGISICRSSSHWDNSCVIHWPSQVEPVIHASVSAELPLGLYPVLRFLRWHFEVWYAPNCTMGRYSTVRNVFSFGVHTLHHV